MNAHTGVRRVVPTLAGTLLAAMAAYGVFVLTTALFHTPAPRPFASLFFVIAFGAIMITPLAFGAYYAFTRRYRDLFMLFAIVAAFVGWGILTNLMSPLFRFLEAHRQNDAWIVISLPAAFFFVLGPYCAASWFIRRCSRFAASRFKNYG